VAIAFS